MRYLTEPGPNPQPQSLASGQRNRLLCRIESPGPWR